MDSLIAQYEYDSQGRRVKSTVNSVVTNYHYDGNSIQVFYETDGSGSLKTLYTYSPGGQLLSMTKVDQGTYYFHYNVHGDVIQLTDQAGNSVAEYTYDAWGNILTKTGTMATANPYRYAGYRYDEETGLYYLIARYYDPSVGRFITRDKFHGFDEYPSSLNQYIYTANNPVMRIDASGNFWTPWGDVTIENGNVSYVNDIGFGTKLAVRVGLTIGRAYVKLTPGGLAKIVGSYYVGSLYKAFQKLIDKELSGVARYMGKYWAKFHKFLFDQAYALIGTKNVNLIKTGLYYTLFEKTWTFW